MKEDLFQLIAWLQNSSLIPPPHTPSPCYLKEPSSDLWLLSIFRGRESYVLISGYISWFTHALLKPTQIGAVLQKTCYQERPVAKKSSSWMKSQHGHWLRVTHLSVLHHSCIFRIVWSQTKHLCKALKTVPIPRLLSLCKFSLKLSFSLGNGMRHLVRFPT